MGFLRCCIYYGILAVVSFFIGRLLPKSWFHGDKFPYRCASWEAKLFRFLRVHEWQDKVPDMSKIVPKLIPAKKLEGDFRAQLPRMIEETCVAELIHALLSVTGLGFLWLWPGGWGIALTVVYILLGNVSFIIIQRYNRPRASARPCSRRSYWRRALRRSPRRVRPPPRNRGSAGCRRAAAPFPDRSHRPCRSPRWP